MIYSSTTHHHHRNRGHCWQWILGRKLKQTICLDQRWAPQNKQAANWKFAQPINLNLARSLSLIVDFNSGLFANSGKICIRRYLCIRQFPDRDDRTTTLGTSQMSNSRRIFIPLDLQVNGGSVADQAGLMPGDALVKVNSTDVFSLRHKEAQDVIVAAGNSFELTVSRWEFFFYCSWI